MDSTTQRPVCPVILPVDGELRLTKFEIAKVGFPPSLPPSLPPSCLSSRPSIPFSSSSFAVSHK